MRMAEPGTYNATNTLRKHIHHLWPFVRSSGPVEKCVEAFIEDNQGQIEDTQHVIVGITPCLDSQSNRLMDTGRILLRHAITLRKACQDRIFVQDPNPELINHDGSRDLSNVFLALFTAILSFIFSVAVPSPILRLLLRLGSLEYIELVCSLHG